MAIDKLIVTNGSALNAKYGKAGYAKIGAAIGRLIAADAKRGLASKLIALDSKADMAAYGAPVNSSSDARAAKRAIDAIYARDRPDYILILGAGDVVPLVPLRNPVYEAEVDDDKTVPSDLPYACASAYSTDINRFLGPTRVVGRLPDMVGASNPEYLLKLIASASGYKTLGSADYREYFGLSAHVWQASTSLSLAKLFGNSAGMKTTPPSGPGWSASQLVPRAHFINCHGAHRDFHYYGQPPGKEEYPEAHSANLLPGKIIPGTILASECCYGAELYDPVKTSGQAGIAYTYLGAGAYGVFGSTTIAYGPSAGNDSADLICQYFMRAVMNGASLGRAALEARQQFAGQYSHLDPTNLKTLAQFYLLGDPAIHAAAIAPHGLNQTKTFRSAFAKTKDAGVRALRRERLQRVGAGLQKDLPATRKAKPGKGAEPSREVSGVLKGAARESGLSRHTSMDFHVSPRTRIQAADAARRTVHLLLSAASPGENGHIKKIVTIVATAENGKLIHLKRLHSR